MKVIFYLISFVKFCSGVKKSNNRFITKCKVKKKETLFWYSSVVFLHEEYAYKTDII